MTRSIAGLEVEIIRKRIKNMHLAVLPPDGRVRVSAPWLMPNAQIDAFVTAKRGWIEAQRQRIAAQSAQRQRIEDGGSIYVWGRAYTLHIAEGKRNSLIIEDDGTATLTMREGSTQEKREDFLKEWYRAELKDMAELYLPKWESATGLKASGWQSKDMSTRWGTCNTRTGKIWLNVRLAQYEPSCLEYVILHELVHLRIPNHGAEFKAMLDRYMPDWRERRKLLNER